MAVHRYFELITLSRGARAKFQLTLNCRDSM